MKRVAAFALAVVTAFALQGGAAEARCPDMPQCKGCGCKGGPGYRGPDNRCVGFRELDKICGVPPTTRCVFENAPGTGANKACALAPREPRRGAKSDPALQ